MVVSIFDAQSEVYGILDYNTSKERYIVCLKNEEDKEEIFFLEKKSAVIIDNKIDDDWVLIKKPKYSSSKYGCKLKLKNILAPKWLAEDQAILFEIYFDNEVAVDRIKIMFEKQ